MSAHNFWNNFSMGFLGGMFNCNPFMGFGGFGNWGSPFGIFGGCGFGGFNNFGFGGFGCCNNMFPRQSLFLYPNVMSGASIFPMMQNTMPTMMDMSIPDVSTMFPTDGWNKVNTDTFIRTNVPKKPAESESKADSSGETTSSEVKSNSTEVETKPPKQEVSSKKLGQKKTPQVSSSAPSKRISALRAKHWSQMTDAEITEVYGNYTRDIRTPYTGTSAKLNKYLKGKGKLENMGQAFMDAQRQYGISAAVLIGIAMNESTGGKSDNAMKRNNIGGVRIPGSTQFKTYSSVRDCIMDMARFLKAGYVNNKGRPLTKLNQVNAKYCPASDKTDGKGLNSYWARNVEMYAKEVESVMA